MSEEDIAKTFESIGIPQTETKVYLDLLKNGHSTATVIARRTKMHRANVYDTLTKLREKNLVYSTVDDGKRVFVALSSDLLLQQQKERTENLKTAINYLQKLYVRTDSPKVYVLEGLGAVKNILFSLLDQKEPIWIYGLAEKEEVTNLLRERFIQMFHAERIKNKIPLKCLFYNYPLEDVQELNKMRFTEARVLPSTDRPKSSEMSQIACKGKLFVTIWMHPIYTIVIESEVIEKEYSDFFSLLWSHSEKL